MYAGQRQINTERAGYEMSTPGPPGGQSVPGRRCASCGASLAADNTANLCSRCHRDQRDQLRTPPSQLRNEFFETPEFRAAFESQHIGRIFKAYRNHPRHLKIWGKALNQELLGRWLGLTQAQISKLENGKPEQNLETLRNYARILHLPQHLLWFDLPGQSRLVLPRKHDSLGGNSQEASRLTAPENRDNILIAATGMDTAEMVRRMRASAIDSSTIDALHIAVDQMCCEYAHGDAAELIRASRKILAQTVHLLNNRLTLTQHRDILHEAGMLSLLVGCLEFDLGDTVSAQATRRMALELGTDAADPMITGWAHEMLAWFHLTAGSYAAVVNAAQAGIIAAPSESVAVQLYGQQAKAYARMGKPEEVHRALENGSELLGRLPFPERPENHFVVDPDKWDFYAMDTYRIVGEDTLAKRNADEVIRRSVSSEGVIMSPMRKAEAELTLGVVAARQGDLDEATSLGIRALQDGRHSRPSLLMVASELEDELRTYGSSAGADFREALKDLRGSGGPPSVTG